ncbi:hypothetical protein Pve01_90270 [Planomonospora venezuelensis]|nr:hypothetical protein Pve01_90270 [Planomonospora venezuelensis]
MTEPVMRSEVGSVVELSEQDLAMLDGDHGAAAALAMRIVVRMAGIQQAPKLIDITHVHVGGSIYTGPGSLDVIECLVQLGAKVRVPTTLNAISIDRVRGVEAGVDPEFIANAARLADALESMGARTTFTCTPYIHPDGPRRGEDILWAESNAIAYANSVIGARTNRHGDFMDIFAAITGRVPYSGLHVPENRYGEVLVRVPQVEDPDTSFFTVLGYLVGKRAGTEVPVIDGIPGTPSLEGLKAFSATVATSGTVGLFHMVGVTPEAPTVDAALAGRAPSRVIDVSREDLLDVWRTLSSSESDVLQSVVMGSPHATLGDFAELARLVEGRAKHPNVDVLITTSRLVEETARAEGWIEAIERFGVRVSTDRCLCMLSHQMLPPGSGAVMTNSGKFAHYGPGLVRRGVYFGSTADCVESAVSGRRTLRTPNWLA